MKAWLEKHMPAPMAAPETEELRTARIRLIAALVVMAVITVSWSLIGGLVAVALLVGLAAYIAILGASWFLAKTKADDEYLTSRITHDE